MWSSEYFPGASHVPWQLLIRARYAHEVDAVVASIAVSAVSAVASASVADEVARAGRGAALDQERTPATPDQQLTALTALADFDDWCGTWWRHWWGPGPRPHVLDDAGDPIASLVLDRVASLVENAGSPALRRTLGAALGQAGQPDRQRAA